MIVEVLIETPQIAQATAALPQIPQTPEMLMPSLQQASNDLSPVVGLCGYKDCDNKLPAGKFATLYGLPQEIGLNPRPWYCSPECAISTRLECYDPIPNHARRLSWTG